MNQPFELAKRSIVATTLIISLIIIICGVMSLLVVSDPALKYSQVLANTALILRDHYPDEMDWDNAITSSRRAMLDELDPFSGYVRHEQLMQFEEDLTGGYYGIGISVIPHDSGLLILDVREGSPAATSGILTGDIIIATDSINLSGKDPFEAVDLIKGKENTVLKATIIRPATADTLNFEIVRKRIEFVHIPFAGFTPDGAVYIRLLDFNAGAAEEFCRALDSLITKDETDLKGIIIDLRGNPGGLFIEAKEIVEIFLEKGDFIVGTASRSRWNEDSYFAQKNGDYSRFPLAILVDNGSASAAEILAGALKYSGHAVLVGDTTFGKGLVQGFIHLPEGDGLRLTISRYFFEGNRFINSPDSASDKMGVGLVPDIYYSFSEEEPFYVQLEQELILLRFAHMHQDEIISSANNGIEKQKWIERLRQYALENNFEYKSVLTAAAELLKEDAGTGELEKLAQRAVEKAELLDKDLFTKFDDFLWLRLMQIAVERKSGTYRAYKEVIVPGYEPIAIAERALVKKDSL